MKTNNQLNSFEELISENKSVEAAADFSDSIIQRFNLEKNNRLRARQARAAYASSIASVLLVFILALSFSRISAVDYTDDSTTALLINELPGVISSDQNIILGDVDEQQASETIAEEVAMSVIPDEDISGLLREYNIDETQLLAELESSEVENLLNY